MGSSVAIWSPVVVAQLPYPYRLKELCTYTLDRVYKSVEDLKIKVKQTITRFQGQAVEAQISLDILCLVEDLAGELCLIAREATIKNRIPILDFEPPLDPNQRIKFVVDIVETTCQGEMDGHELQVFIFIDYLLMATCEQVVKLSTEGENASSTDSMEEALSRLSAEINRIEGENQSLRRRIYLYERDIMSLKKGISKAERRNTGLNRELGRYRQLAEELQESIRERDRQLIQYHNPYYHNNMPEKDLEEQPGLGTRIKRMFISNQ